MKLKGAKPVVLIGFMGTGKTTCGRLLARRLGWRHLDCDTLIQKKTKKTIHRIFKEDGEGVFRRMESQILRKLLDSRRVVISTGGGVVLNARNRALMRRKGFVVWLRASESVIARRVLATKTRPLLKVKNPVREISRLLKKREPFYRHSAHMSIRSDTQKAVPVLSQIIRRCGLE